MTHRRQGREQRTVALGITDQPVTVEKCVMLTITLRWPRDHVGHQVKELIELLEADVWYQVRMKGSHRQFHHPTKKGTVTVAGKPNVDIPPATLNSAIKQAGLKKER